jgi:serine/threonine protein kinase
MVSAIAYLHHPVQGIGHRDIKPANFLLTRDGYVKLIDFGISYELNAKDRTEDLWPERADELYVQVSTGCVTFVLGLGTPLNNHLGLIVHPSFYSEPRTTTSVLWTSGRWDVPSPSSSPQYGCRGPKMTMKTSRSRRTLHRQTLETVRMLSLLDMSLPFALDGGEATCSMPPVVRLV